MAWTFDFMLTVFRALGGTADNLRLGEGAYGRGLFAIDPENEVRLHVPENLLIPVEDVQFVEGALKVNPEASIGAPERTFFENYQESMSWGAGGRRQALAFIESVDSLPAAIRAILSDEFGIKPLLDGDNEARARRWFLNSRKIDRGPRDVVMPVVELINHSTNGVLYRIDDGVWVTGKFQDEVLVHYSITDPFGIFQAFGFASPERVAFSLPLKHEKRRITVLRDVNFRAKLGSFEVPEHRVEAGTLVLTSLMIGNANFPRLSRGIFQHLMRDAGLPDADETFDLILHENRMKFLKLLQALEACSGDLPDTLRKMVRYQLQAMSFCIGTRVP